MVRYNNNRSTLGGSIGASLLGLLLLLGLSGAAHGQASPWLDWQTLSSPHFNIHFPAEAEAKARRALAIAERVHERLAPEIGWQPYARTEIVLTDQVDLANGFASPLPYNHIYLYATPPDGISTLADYDDWLELLITHEYTHTLHLDKASGFPAGARWALGRYELLFPNLFQPTWMIEGLAIHQETDDERGIGRGQSALFDMQMRMEVADGIKPFDQVSMSGITEWPLGNTPYLYGAWFYRFVEAEHGPERIRELVDNYSNNAVPFLLNRNFRQTLGTDGAAMWAEFEDYLESIFGPRLEAIRRQGVIAGERLTSHGYGTASADAVGWDEVFYVRDEVERAPALMRWTPDTGARHIARLRAPARIDAHPEHGVLVAQPEICRNRNIYYDLYHVDPESGDTRRLTHCQRYRDAAWGPDGERIIASRIELGEARLDLLDRDGDYRETLWQGEQGEVPGRMDWSADGSRLAVAMWRPGRGWALELFDPDSRRWRALTEGPTVEGDPAFTPDGDSLLFSSAHGGVYDIRRMDLDSGETVSLTRVEGGAFSPTQGHPAGPMFYVGYTADGHDLFRLRSPRRELPLPEGRKTEPQPSAEERPAGGEPRDYRPWSTLRPRSWLPVLAVTDAVTEVGVSLGSFDVLQNHAYSLVAARELNEGLSWGGVSYNFANRLQLLAFRGYEYDTREVEDGNDDEDERELEHARAHDQVQARLTLPWLRMNRTVAAHLGGGIVRESDRFVADGASERADETSGVAGLALTFDNADRHTRSISRSHGRRIRLVGESNEAFGSDFTGDVYTLDWREFLPLGGQHVLALRAVQGWGTEAPREFRLGEATASDLVGPDALFDKRRYALRGYPDSFRGRRVRLYSGEWRLPLYRLERSFTRFPVGLHQVSGRVIGEAGAAWNEGDNPEELFTSAGLELVGDFNAFYLLNFRARLGVAKGLDEGGEYEGYLLLESGF